MSAHERLVEALTYLATATALAGVLAALLWAWFAA